MEGIVNALGIRVPPQRKVPVCRQWDALEEGCEKDGDGMERVQDVEGVDRISHRLLVATEVEEEDEDRGFDEGEDGVVEHLDKKVPPVSGPWIKVGDVLFVPSPIVELHDCQ